MIFIIVLLNLLFIRRVCINKDLSIKYRNRTDLWLSFNINNLFLEFIIIDSKNVQSLSGCIGTFHHHNQHLTRLNQNSNGFYHCWTKPQGGILKPRANQGGEKRDPNCYWCSDKFRSRKFYSSWSQCNLSRPYLCRWIHFKWSSCRFFSSRSPGRNWLGRSGVIVRRFTISRSSRRRNSGSICDSSDNRRWDWCWSICPDKWTYPKLIGF